MQIIITLKISENGTEKKLDVQVDQQQRISNSLDIIWKSFNIKKELEKINFIKSQKNNRWISTNYTFEQGEIFTGDILEI